MHGLTTSTVHITFSGYNVNHTLLFLCSTQHLCTYEYSPPERALLLLQVGVPQPWASSQRCMLSRHSFWPRPSPSTSSTHRLPTTGPQGHACTYLSQLSYVSHSGGAYSFMGVKNIPVAYGLQQGQPYPDNRSGLDKGTWLAAHSSPTRALRHVSVRTHVPRGR